MFAIIEKSEVNNVIGGILDNSENENSAEKLHRIVKVKDVTKVK